MELKKAYRNCDGFKPSTEATVLKCVEQLENVNDSKSLANSGFTESETNLFSYEDIDRCPDYNFGLIRGYHKELYEEKQSNDNELVLCCQTLDPETVRRMKRRNRILSYQVAGILCGAAFVFFGVTSLIVTFGLSFGESDKRLLSSLRNIPTLYLHVVAISGLSLLTLGTVTISLCLLLPIFVARIGGQEAPIFWCTTGDFYVKHAEKMAPNHFLYFDATRFADVVGNTDARKVQPELNN